MPPNEPCPHCGQLILDWHNEWYDATQRRAIYSGQAAMDCPLCRRAVLWFESRDLATPPAAAPLVYQRSALLAAQWVPVRRRRASTWLATSPTTRPGNSTTATGRRAKCGRPINR